MYIEGKNKWSTSTKKDGKCRELEVIEIENGFICRIYEYNQSTLEVPASNEDRKEKIVYSKTNPLEGTEKETEKTDVLNVNSMFANMAKSMGKFLVDK